MQSALIAMVVATLLRLTMECSMPLSWAPESFNTRANKADLVIYGIDVSHSQETLYHNTVMVSVHVEVLCILRDVKGVAVSHKIIIQEESPPVRCTDHLSALETGAKYIMFLKPVGENTFEFDDVNAELGHAKATPTFLQEIYQNCWIWCQKVPPESRHLSTSTCPLTSLSHQSCSSPTCSSTPVTTPPNRSSQSTRITRSTAEASHVNHVIDRGYTTAPLTRPVRALTEAQSTPRSSSEDLSNSNKSQQSRPIMAALTSTLRAMSTRVEQRKATVNPHQTFSSLKPLNAGASSCLLNVFSIRKSMVFIYTAPLLKAWLS